jgi:hypothetical protein
MLEELIDAFLVAAVLRELPVRFPQITERVKQLAKCDAIDLDWRWYATTDGQFKFAIDLRILRFNSWRTIEKFSVTYKGAPSFTDLDDGIAELLDEVTKVARRNRFKVDGAD